MLYQFNNNNKIIICLSALNNFKFAYNKGKNH